MASAADIGIDLGTSNIVVYVKGKGIVIRESALIAYDRDVDKVRAVGEEARQMLGRTPGNLSAVRPLKTGSITDYVLTEQLLRYFIQKAMGRRGFIKPRIAISVPTRLTDVERRAVEEASYQAGAREVIIVPEPIAAAIGSGLEVTRPVGNMVVDIGGGTSDIAVISLGGTVVNASVKVAGDDFDEAIVRYIRKRHNLLIGERTAEEIKIGIGCVYPLPETQTMDVKGRNLTSGLPKTVSVTSDEMLEALHDTAMQIVDAIHNVLERTPPELAADIYERGIIMTGGGALLSGFDELIEEKTGINTIVAEDPMTAVAIGTGRFVEYMNENPAGK